MNFDEYWSDGFNSYGDARDAAKDAWQEQQAKIDILQIKLNGADERAAAVLNHKNKMIDELQARIDEALNMLCKLQYSSGERIYNDVGNILKGNKDEARLN